ncbi:hypothetical protein D5282_16785 [bacterium 1xD8-48]|nr:hypothetical protein [bacterium 1xD8-48]
MLIPLKETGSIRSFGKHGRSSGFSNRLLSHTHFYSLCSPDCSSPTIIHPLSLSFLKINLFLPVLY